MRLALGSGRGRLVRQVLAECLALGSLGALGGIAVTQLALGLLPALGPAELPRLEEVGVDGAVLTFAMLTAVTASVLFGVVPALQASRVEPGSQLREGSRGASGGPLTRLRGTFVVAQFGLALLLLVSASLLMRSFLNLRAVEPGFDPERVLSFALALPVARYPSGDELRAFYAHLEEGLAAVPGVTEVGVVSTLFLSDLPNMGGVSVEARPEAYEQATEFPVVRDAASTGFFGAAGMEIVAGRAVDGTDVSGGTSVAVVNEAFARIHLAGLDPIGQRFMWGVPSGEDPAWVTVVGVVEDARRSGLDRPVRPSAFVPTTQAPERRTDVLVKTSVDPMVVAEAVRDVVEDLDARLPVTRVRTLEQAMSDSLAGRRFVAWLLGLFAVSALALAAVGIFGVMAYVVAQRTREIGIRVALGAERSSVLARTLGEGMLQAGIGLVMGAAASLGLTGVVRGQLYGIEPTDATTFALASAMLIGTAAVACLVPALRAAAVDPVVALRED